MVPELGDRDVELPYLNGQSKLVLHPAPENADAEWYINDHCFVEGKDGVLHFIGVNNPYPSATPSPYSAPDLGIYAEHPYMGHATSTDPLDHWERHPHALVDEREAAHIGAPDVVWVEGREEYVMLLKTGEAGRADRLEIVTSPDLYEWSRSGTFVLPDCPSGTRDPCIRRTDSGQFSIYMTTGDAVILTETADFTSFEPVQTCLELQGVESPFVLQRNDLYYLFATHAHRHYYETLVYVSDRPDAFPKEQVVTTLYTHAPEIVTYRGTTYLSSCGPEDDQGFNDHGLYMAELEWVVP